MQQATANERKWTRITGEPKIPGKSCQRPLKSDHELIKGFVYESVRFSKVQAISGGIIDGLNNKVKVTFRKSYVFAPTKPEKSLCFTCLANYPSRKLSMVSFRQPKSS
jgi:hypothetical protein